MNMRDLILAKRWGGGSSGGGGGGVTIRNQNKTITENGTYTADSGYTGLGTVTVDVASGGSTGGNNFNDCVTGVTTALYSDAEIIVESACYSWTFLTSVEFPNATSVGNYAFGQCAKLESANFPNVTRIGGNAFQNCTALKTVSATNATSIGNSSFAGCIALISTNLPNITSISGNAFSGCRVLTSVDFPNVISIASASLQNCYVLKSVILRSETMCTLSNKNVFTGCYHIHGTVNSTYNPNGDKDGYFYVPRALLSDDDETKDYRRATNWSNFATQFRALEDYTVDGTITGALDPTKI